MKPVINISEFDTKVVARNATVSFGKSLVQHRNVSKENGAGVVLGDGIRIGPVEHMIHDDKDFIDDSIFHH